MTQELLDQDRIDNWCGTEQALAEYRQEVAERRARKKRELERLGYPQDFPDALLDQLNLSALQQELPNSLSYDAGAVIDMNNKMCGLTPYLPPFQSKTESY